MSRDPAMASVEDEIAALKRGNLQLHSELAKIRSLMADKVVQIDDGIQKQHAAMNVVVDLARQANAMALVSLPAGPLHERYEDDRARYMKIAAKETAKRD